MHGRLETAVLDHPKIRQWQERFELAKRQNELEKTVFDRELFFGIQPKERLQDLLERYRMKFAHARN